MRQLSVLFGSFVLAVGMTLSMPTAFADPDSDVSSDPVPTVVEQPSALPPVQSAPPAVEQLPSTRVQNPDPVPAPAPTVDKPAPAPQPVPPQEHKAPAPQQDAPVSGPASTSQPELPKQDVVPVKPAPPVETVLPSATESGGTTLPESPPPSTQDNKGDSQAPASTQKQEPTTVGSPDESADSSADEGGETAESSTAPTTSKSPAAGSGETADSQPAKDDSAVESDSPASESQTEDSTGGTESVDEVTPETVTVDQPTVAVPADTADVADPATLPEVAAAPVKEASQESVDEVALAIDTVNAANATASRPGDNRGNRPPANRKAPDPRGWQCKDPRGVSWCQWNDWSHDSHGRPVFENRFSFDLKVIYVDSVDGRRVEVVVGAHSKQPINVPRSGDYSFVVVGVSSNAYATNVGVGVFSSGNGVRPSVNVTVQVNVWRGNVPVYVPVPVYDPGRGVYRHDHGRDYYKYYFGGTREVVGYWVGAPHGPHSHFVPVEYCETPASVEYTKVTSDNVGVLVGVDMPGGDPSDNPVSLTPVDQQDDVVNAAALAAVAAATILVAGAVTGVVVYRRRRQ